ncbi:TolC family protein [Mesonia sp.]|uniref:TolC family protein n=1 Tax=Mesonia sp. TaxID=1960830 RepID=UPI00177A2A0F|nr:TolC family protein [Mesonia sp.]HIB38022.1 TolC family protein [Mesonia sp.]HIO27436.1 TolC family protein [Flavobacteriaceae bacterium]
MRIYLSCFLLIFSATLFAQESTTSKEIYAFSLEEAIDFALDSSYTAINAKRDIAAAAKKKWETTADGLPQISGAVDYQNNLKQPVQLIPAEFFGGPPGTYSPVVFGTKQNLSATATASQLLFDGSYIVGVRAAKTFEKYTTTNAERTALEIRQDVIDAYGNVLLAEESVSILKSNKDNLQDNLEETRKIYENGLQEEESVEQLQITYLQISNELNNAERLVAIARDALKLTLGISLDKEVNLIDNLEGLVEENISLPLLNSEMNIEENLDYQLAQVQIEQREHELNLQKAKALPTLSTFINYGTTGNSQKFTFLNDNQQWFQSSIWGVSLNIPIFSSLKRSAQTAQARIALDQAQTQFEQSKEQIRLGMTRATNDYQYAIEKYRTSEQNLDLAERIENKNQVKFSEGIATSFELRQAQTQLYDAQQELLQSMLEVLNAKAALETLLNTPNINFTNK